MAYSWNRHLCAPASGSILCKVEDLTEGEPCFLLLPRGKSYGFPYYVIKQGDEVRAFMDRCPHHGRPLSKNGKPVQLENDLITCPSHGAVFKILDGFCVDGPCKGGNLPVIDVKIENDCVVVA